MNKRLSTILQYIFFFGLGIFLVWWSIRELTPDDKVQISQALKKARYWLVLPVFAILFLSHFVRGLRWRLLIESMGYLPTKANTFFAVMIGYLANQAVPRLGEVLKCTILARYEKIPADKLIGTIILERIIDAISLLIIFGITLAIQPGLYNQLMDTFFTSSGNEEVKKVSGLIILLAAVVLFGLLLGAWMIFKKKSWRDVILLFKMIGNRIWQGISAIQHLRKRGQFLVLTLLLWVLYLGGGYIGFQALQETSHYGVRESFTVLSAGSVGMIVTPGGIGAYAYILEKTMLLYGLPKGIALAFGWLLWLAQTAVVLIGGLLSFVAIPWYNKKRAIAKG
ncbi:MAG TPA: lysylphosphatidylglycerol synthase transmembrane domain-containing protein [Chitinophagaceae bacterium]|nr:lysylphosphatidylglycerol synthase transmembrane domain-containing protein [Chitinophagaceae bacterium]